MDLYIAKMKIVDRYIDKYFAKSDSENDTVSFDCILKKIHQALYWDYMHLEKPNITIFDVKKCMKSKGFALKKQNIFVCIKQVLW